MLFSPKRDLIVRFQRLLVRIEFSEKKHNNLFHIALKKTQATRIQTFAKWTEITVLIKQLQLFNRLYRHFLNRDKKNQCIDKIVEIILIFDNKKQYHHNLLLTISLRFYSEVGPDRFNFSQVSWFFFPIQKFYYSLSILLQSYGEELLKVIQGSVWFQPLEFF